jgi:D-glycero-alpha-D-manno-heptose-7-phosphate kinase|tara:strand:- start:9505 stop:10467 length:963 start_codon:yes stop_codon:yes gene_type:complete
MIISKAPLRISLFGGSTDYKEFYEEHESLCIGTTIDKHYFSAIRYRPSIITEGTLLSYSKQELVKNINDIEHPLIREALRYFEVTDPIELKVFSDIPSRTGLGGSSSFCVSLIHSIFTMQGRQIDKKDIAEGAIKLEREILGDAGGVQDQIWAAYGGLNSIEIKKNGDFFVRPLPVSLEFKNELESSMLLIYTGEQRVTDDIAKSHQNKDKKTILDIARAAYKAFERENIDDIGSLLLSSWREKSKISNLISTPAVKEMAEAIEATGCIGLKLLGAGGCGFLMVICNPFQKTLLKEKFGSKVMPFKFDDEGVRSIYENGN